MNPSKHQLKIAINPRPQTRMLAASLFCLVASLSMGTAPALAVRYTQILPNASSQTDTTGSPNSQGATAISARVYSAGSPQVYRPVVYPGKITQFAPAFSLPARVVQSLNQPLLGPQAILDFIKTKDSIPATVAPTISVEKSSVLNSYTDGQGIVITSGLLDKLHTSDQRAFVISHELSHVLLSHVAKTQVRRVGLSLFDALVVQRYVGKGTPLDSATRFGLGLVDMRSSRGFEYQADDLGVRLMSEAGYNPEAALQVFDVLKANTPRNQTPGFLMDHPITNDRIQALVRKYQLQPQ